MRCVLIVDDEPMIRKGLSIMIQQCGEHPYNIKLAQNGEEAIQLIMEEQPDFLFTDIRMPKVDGLELCRRLSEMETDIQTVVISGYGDFEYARQCVSYGVKEYLLKPVSKGNLQNVIGKLEAHREKLESFVSVAKLDEWVVRMDDAIWTLDKERLYLVLKEWETDFLQRKMSRSQQKELLEEGYALLVKKLLVNSVTPGKSVLDLSAAAGPEQLFRCFAEASAAILEELRRKRKGKAKDPIEEAKAFIEKHLAQEVSLEEVAEVLGLNASYFSQMFKHSTGETFVHYRIKRRMEKAKRLLADASYRITDISYEVGYADHPHFTKTFKKFTGLAPSEYRNQLGID
ncbi:response regulator [Paenibacillus odorifer]|uniref:response regulator transcription factor n=1 Tax=Paenibacillus TaxID=44249 RepID=UPI00096CEC19|nr:response regulator [Paenibacillus odorifer]OME22746.1 DNA-binding response regulator [Paenibacillus odorifer]OME38295.1 DNA-binding response regulator [Paenibacillus odorifer]OME41757.1 DNA-binding response regulator [Paenibacillus odorifer]